MRSESTRRIIHVLGNLAALEPGAGLFNTNRTEIRFQPGARFPSGTANRRRITTSLLRLLPSTVGPDSGLPLRAAVMVHSRARTSREGYNANRSSEPAWKPTCSGN